jgi:drug/metabolite transporter (DMT)-like permease
MVLALGLLAAVIFGSAVVLQERSAREVPAALAARPGLLLRLVRRPLWLLGLAADIVAFAVQALALHLGSLVVVQPLIATSLVFTLAVIAIVDHEPLSSREWSAIGLVLVGLAIFLAAGSPAASSAADIDEEAWVLCIVSVGVVIGVAAGSGLRARGPNRARWFGLAAGVADAFMAVLAKAFADSFGQSAAGVFLTWVPYALVVAGLSAVLLVSTAYQTGHPTSSLPIITVADPLFGCVIGLMLFSERLQLQGVRGPLVAVAVVVMGLGLYWLGRDERIAARVGSAEAAGTGPSVELG